MPDLSNYPTGLFIQNPTEIQSRRTQTIQTHNAVSIVASGSSEGAWIDCDGFDKIAFTMLLDASKVFRVQYVWSSDGVSRHAYEVASQPTAGSFAHITDIKARYCRILVENKDTTSMTASAWAYLKV